jgi:hypothetical protein
MLRGRQETGKTIDSQTFAFLFFSLVLMDGVDF